MQTFKVSVFVLLLMSSFGLSTVYALPAGITGSTTTFSQTDSKKLTKAERKAFKKSLKAKIKQERKRAKQLKKKAKERPTKANKTQRDFSNRALLIGLLVGLGLILLGRLIPFLGSIVSLIGSLLILVVIVLFVMRYV